MGIVDPNVVLAVVSRSATMFTVRLVPTNIASEPCDHNGNGQEPCLADEFVVGEVFVIELV